VTELLPTGSAEVVQVAVPGVPEVTEVVPQPVFALHATEPFTASECAPSERIRGLTFFSKPYCPEIVAVNVTDWPYTDGFVLDVTTVVAVASFTTWV
jgi:hypothetical protein